MRPIEIQPARLTRTTEKVATAGPAKPAPAVANGEDEIEVARSLSLQPGEPPVDSDRVEQIRKGIEQGNYPLVPAKIADAMIAAGIMLRSVQ